jgi:hypothetical protein
MLLHLGCRLMEWNMSQFLIERYEGRIAGVLSWPALVAVFPVLKQIQRIRLHQTGHFGLRWSDI